MKFEMPYELVLGWRYTRAGRATRRNGFISFISGVSMLGIGLGVAALVIVLSVMNGFQKEVRDRMLSVVSHIEIVSADGGALEDLAGTLKQVQSNAQVLGAAPFISAQALLARGEDMKGVLVRGIDPALEPTVVNLSAGMAGNAENSSNRGLSMPGVEALKPGQFGVVLGLDLARQLGLRLGDPVTLISPNGQVTPAGVLPRLKQMEVVGLFNSGHYEYDSALVMLHVEDAGKIFRLEGPTGVRLKIKDLHEARSVARELAPTLSAGMAIRDWTQQNKTWFAAVQVEKRMMFIILTLIVAVAAFNLVSTLVMSVTDKRADIAILRTLGASPKSIMGVFMVQGAMVGFIGTVGGLLLGLVIAFNIDVIVPALETLFRASFLPKDIYLISRMPSDPQMADILPVAVISLLLAFVATLYPSWRASQVNPAEALRYE
jgi:lipoprotein-releasing system permease protein